MNEILTFIKKVTDGANLTRDEAGRAFQIIMSHGATPAQISGFLVALKMKGETVEEITGAVTAIKNKAQKIKADGDILDTCGTGGDNSGTFNISTASALVVAGCGVKVAKHGNKAVSSSSGSADVLRELSVKIDIDKEKCEQILQKAGICFLFAQKFHPAMRDIGPIRQELGFRTIFNILGPLTNPASAKFQLIGVYSKHLLLPLAEVLKNLGSKRAWVVHGSDGLDELTTTGITHVVELNDGEIKEFEVKPEDAGLEVEKKENLEGGQPRYNAEAIISLLGGSPGAFRNIVLLNSAAALIVAGRAKDLKEGVAMAAESIDSGRAKEKLHKLVELSNSE